MLSSTIITSLVQLAILIPFIVIGWRHAKNKASITPLVWIAIIFIIAMVLQSQFSGTLFFKGQQYNWVGKGAAFIFLLICLFIIPGYTRKDFYVAPPDWRNARTILLICVIYLGVRLVLYLVSNESSTTIHSETFLFQATLPGMEEELLFRGLLLGLFNAVFMQKWSIAKVSFGWGAILTSILFGLTHGLFVSSHFQVHFEAMNFARTAFEGFLFALLVQKTKSIVPAVIYHNLLNLISNH